MLDDTTPVECCKQFLRPGDDAFYNQRNLSLIRLARAAMAGEPDAVRIAGDLINRDAMRAYAGVDPDSFDYRQHDSRQRSMADLLARYTTNRAA
jgi:hypothetical protein